MLVVFVTFVSSIVAESRSYLGAAPRKTPRRLIAALFVEVDWKVVRVTSIALRRARRKIPPFVFRPSDELGVCTGFQRLGLCPLVKDACPGFLSTSNLVIFEGFGHRGALALGPRDWL